MKPIDKLLTDIAGEHLGITSLETSEAAPLNFHQVPLDGLKRALQAAYAAGASRCVVVDSDQRPVTFDSYEMRGADGTRYCEPAPDKDAHYWSLYGHISGEGLTCIGDFKTRAAAEAIYARITGQLFE